MKVLYWNIRGLANSPSRLALKRLILLHKPDLIFISEPWIPYVNFPQTWFQRLGFKLFSFNERGNLKPNLWCFCATDLNPHVIDKDAQQVTFNLLVNSNLLCFTAVYASTSNLTRRDLWSKLNNLQTTYNAPWTFIGDFHSIMGAHEHCGSLNPARSPINDFILWTDTFDLTHLPTRGATFTWDNRRSGRRHIKRRLNRTIVNSNMLDLCSNISCSTLTKTSSDHYPILLDFKTDSIRFASSFKFLKMWTLHNDCKQLFSDTWKINVVGCPMYVLSAKLKILKGKLKLWNKDVFGNIHEYVAAAETKLSDIQTKINLLGHSDTLMNEEKQAQIDLDQALNKQESFWKEKARLNWHVNGDRNTRYFHRITKIKNKTKVISSIRNIEEIITDPQRISNHVVDYYKNLFSTNFVLQDSLLVEEVIPSLIDDQTNHLLTMIPSAEEIKAEGLDKVTLYHLFSFA